jgi:hypothetical protein
MFNMIGEVYSLAYTDILMAFVPPRHTFSSCANVIKAIVLRNNVF